jgi:hypothetical protein
MNRIYYSKITDNRFGFTNQIFSLVTNLVIAYKIKKNVVIVNDFLDDITRETYTPISQIFDLEKTNKYINDRYNLLLCDSNHVDFKVVLVTYGNKYKTLNITNNFIKKYVKDNTLYISKRENLNSIQGDPSPGNPKRLYILYSINGVMFEESFDESFSFLVEDISFDLSKAEHINKFGWINTIDKIMFEDILQNIYYHSRFHQISKQFFKTNMISSKTINVIHLRLEPDAIMHWSKINNMNPYEYKTAIESKYIDTIQKYLNKNDATIILTYSTDNIVIEYLKKNGYIYYVNTKLPELGREQNAIIDLVISTRCNNIFIGNFTVDTLSGSTFSYYIKQLTNAKYISIDLDHIQEPVSISFLDDTKKF